MADQRPPQPLDRRRRVGTPHVGHQTRRRRLQGNVEVRAHAAFRHDEFEKSRSQVLRLDRGDPDPRSRRRPQNPLQQRGQVRRRVEVRAPGAGLDAAQHHLRNAATREPADLLEHRVLRNRPRLSAHRRHDAVGATGVAAVLDPQRDPPPPSPRRRRAGRQQALGHQTLANRLREGQRPRVGKRQVRPQLPRLAFPRQPRVAARHHDAQVGMLAPQPPDRLARVALGPGRHRRPHSAAAPGTLLPPPAS